MGLTTRDRKLLWARSGNFCALCKCPVTEDVEAQDGAIILGEEAHIVSGRVDGPRYRPLPLDQIDSYENLIIVCPSDHRRIDTDLSRYTEARLRQLKQDHEQWARIREPAPSSLRLVEAHPGKPTWLFRVLTGGDLMSVLGGVEACGRRNPEPRSVAEAELIASFVQSVLDWNDIWDDIGAAGQVRAEYDLSKQIDLLRGAGLLVYAGVRQQLLTGGVGAPVPFHTGIIAIHRDDDPQVVGFTAGEAPTEAKTPDE